ncbi:MAG: PfkB domain protein [Acidimicrobiales bacterium]|nr:PfkB domain protein [Acidimicrobiales bacterium]
MAEASIDVVCSGNALVDVLATVTDEQLAALGIVKNSYELVDAETADRLYAAMPPAVEISGGAAANTAVGVVSLGGTAGYIGKIREDQLGAVFRHDLRAAGVGFETAAAGSGPATGRALTLITPDANRTFRTYLGAANELTPDDVDEVTVAAAQVTYLEGYLWDPPGAKEAFRKAMRLAHEAGRKVSLTLSDPFCVDNWGHEFAQLLEQGLVDILFANEAELLALYPELDFDAAVARLRTVCPLAAVTRGEHGSLVVAGEETHEVPAAPVGDVVDTTGAGDLYAAGFLFGLTHGEPLARCGELGSVCAAEVISHVGARPQQRLAELVASS